MDSLVSGLSPNAQPMVGSCAVLSVYSLRRANRGAISVGECGERTLTLTYHSIREAGASASAVAVRGRGHDRGLADRSGPRWAEASEGHPGALSRPMAAAGAVDRTVHGCVQSPSARRRTTGDDPRQQETAVETVVSAVPALRSRPAPARGKAAGRRSGPSGVQARRVRCRRPPAKKGQATVMATAWVGLTAMVSFVSAAAASVLALALPGRWPPRQRPASLRFLSWQPEVVRVLSPSCLVSASLTTVLLPKRSPNPFLSERVLFHRASCAAPSVER